MDNKGKTKGDFGNQKNDICSANQGNAKDGSVEEFDNGVGGFEDNRDNNVAKVLEAPAAIYFGSMSQNRKEILLLKLQNLTFKSPFNPSTEEIHLKKRCFENIGANPLINRKTESQHFFNYRTVEGKSDQLGKNSPVKPQVTEETAMLPALSQEKSSAYLEWINTEQGIKFKQRFLKALAKRERQKYVKCEATLSSLSKKDKGFIAFNLNTLDVRTQKKKHTKLIIESYKPDHDQQQYKCVEIPVKEAMRTVGAASKVILSTEGKKIVFAIDGFAVDYIKDAQAAIARHLDFFHRNNRYLAYQIDIFEHPLYKGRWIVFSPIVPGKNLYEFDMYANEHNDVRVANRMMLRSVMKLVNVLEDMHANGVVYRDPKSPNLMFNPAYNPKYIKKVDGKTLFTINDKIFDLDSPDSLHSLIEYSNDADIPLEEIFSLEDQLACFVDFDTVADKARSDSLAHFVGTPVYRPYSAVAKQVRTPSANIDGLFQCAIESDDFGIGKLCLELTAQNKSEQKEIQSFFEDKKIGSVGCVQTKENTFKGMKKYLRRFIQEEYLDAAYQFFKDTSKFYEQNPDLTLAKMIKPISEIPFP